MSINERTHKILLDVLGIKEVFFVFNAVFEDNADNMVYCESRLSNMRDVDEDATLTWEVELLKKLIAAHQFEENEVLDVMAVAFYSWFEGDDEMPSCYELSHVEVLASESYILPILQPCESGVPF